MKFDFVAFLGGLTVGAAGAALFGALGGKSLLGQTGAVAGGGFGGGSYTPGGFGGPGVFAGTPSGGGNGSMGPSVFEMAPADGEDGLGPIVSVNPTIHGTGAFGDSFFGVNVAPWFWPLNILPIMQWPLVPRDEEIICRKSDQGDGETLLCRRRYPVQPVAWGPPAVWL